MSKSPKALSGYTLATIHEIKILISALASKVISDQELELTKSLMSQQEVDTLSLARNLGDSKLIRELSLTKADTLNIVLPKPNLNGSQVLYKGQAIGKIQILYKSPLPGELQARLALESAIDRFLEYLQKLHQIVVLDESDHHVRVFIPNKQIPSFTELWKEFIKKIAFSAYGDTKYQLPGLIQTFIQMLNSVTLSGRGFSTLDVPILTTEQSNVLAAWYFAVVRDVGERQNKRQQQINNLERELAESDLDEKERKRKTKDLQDKYAKQDQEAQKYTEYFRKSFIKSLEEQNTAWQELGQIETQLTQIKLTKSEQCKLQKQQEKLKNKLILSQESIQQKLELLNESGDDPFKFLQLDEQKNLDKFKVIRAIAKNFTKTATDQINSTRGDIFTQCIAEMYRLLEMEKPSDPLPQPLLTEQPILPKVRAPGDESKEFCYSCGVVLDPKTARWQVLRFMFERPSQRRQSASSEGRPHICASCSALAFASPLKVTDNSIILKLESADSTKVSELKIKDYLRMLTTKEMHLSVGRYLALTSEHIHKGDNKIYASDKLGKVQYALAKVASLFSVEVLADFNFYLITQGSQSINLASRHLVFIKGLIDSYGQSIKQKKKEKDEEINMDLGDAVRYVQQDLPCLANYTLTKTAGISNKYHLEEIYEYYWKAIQNDLKAKGVDMGSDNQLAMKARLYRDVAALTGITYAFAQSLESTAKQAKKGEDYVEREVSKLIEKVDDAVAFCYYATLGDETKRSVQARLYSNPDNYFIYEQAKKLLDGLGISNREGKDDIGKIYLSLYADDILNIYQHFAENGYSQDKEWKDLTYQLKLSLYTRFPELVRRQKSTSEK